MTTMSSSESDGGAFITGLDLENFARSIGDHELELRLFRVKIGAYFEAELNKRSEVLFAFVRPDIRIPLILSLGIW
jgi:hypothetical protein